MTNAEQVCELLAVAKTIDSDGATDLLIATAALSIIRDGGDISECVNQFRDAHKLLGHAGISIDDDNQTIQ